LVTCWNGPFVGGWLELEGGPASGRRNERRYEPEPFNRDNKSTWSCDLFRVGSNDFTFQKKVEVIGAGSPQQIT
jgi:hypothetical protein